MSEAVARVDEILERAGKAPVLEATALQVLGMLLAMEGRVGEGRQLLLSGFRTVRDAGHLVNAAGSVQRLAFVERRAGGSDVEQRIESVLREGLEELERLGDRVFLPTVALDLAGSVERQGRDEEARALCTIARERTLPDDTVNFVYVDVIDARLARKRGEMDQAERLARRSLELVETTDFFALRGMRVRGTLAEILADSGKSEEAVKLAVEAVAIHEAKGDVAGVAVLLERFQALGIELA